MNAACEVLADKHVIFLCRMQLQLSFKQSCCPREGPVSNSIQGVRGDGSVRAPARGKG